MPSGWDWEWLLQIDCLAGGPGLPSVLGDDRRLRVGRNRCGGPAVARTTALARAGGTLVHNLDADDQLTPNALADAVRVLASDRTIGWTTGPVIDLFPDGSTARWDKDPSQVDCHLARSARTGSTPTISPCTPPRSP